MKYLMAVIVCLSLTVSSYGQGSCIRCKIFQGCQSSTSGGCQCDSGGQTCSSCGFCGAGGCVQPCQFLISDPAGIKSSQWFLNRNLAGDLHKTSYTFSVIWANLQERMIKTGQEHLKEGITYTTDGKVGVPWHANHVSGTQYATIWLDGTPLPPDAPESPNRLVLDKDKWYLYRDSKHVFGLWTSHEEQASGPYR